VFFWDDRQARPLYSGTVALRLCAPHRLAVAVAMLGIAVAAAACSSVQRDSLMVKQIKGTTGSTNRPDQIGPADAAAAHVSNADLADARAAAADVLARGPKVNSVPRRNPQTGVGGNITLPARERVGLPCRDFLSSFVSGASRAWLQGSACRSARDGWQVKSPETSQIRLSTPERGGAQPVPTHSKAALRGGGLAPTFNDVS
jgi:surface antigen